MLVKMREEANLSSEDSERPQIISDDLLDFSSSAVGRFQTLGFTGISDFRCVMDRSMGCDDQLFYVVACWKILCFANESRCCCERISGIDLKKC